MGRVKFLSLLAALVAVTAFSATYVQADPTKALHAGSRFWTQNLRVANLSIPFDHPAHYDNKPSGWLMAYRGDGITSPISYFPWELFYHITNGVIRFPFDGMEEPTSVLFEITSPELEFTPVLLASVFGEMPNPQPGTRTLHPNEMRPYIETYKMHNQGSFQTALVTNPWVNIPEMYQDPFPQYGRYQWYGIVTQSDCAGVGVRAGWLNIQTAKFFSDPTGFDEGGTQYELIGLGGIFVKCEIGPRNFMNWIKVGAEELWGPGIIPGTANYFKLIDWESMETLAQGDLESDDSTVFEVNSNAEHDTLALVIMKKVPRTVTSAISESDCLGYGDDSKDCECWKDHVCNTWYVIQAQNCIIGENGEYLPPDGSAGNDSITVISRNTIKLGGRTFSASGEGAGGDGQLGGETGNFGLQFEHNEEDTEGERRDAQLTADDGNVESLGGGYASVQTFATRHCAFECIKCIRTLDLEVHEGCLKCVDGAPIYVEPAERWAYYWEEPFHSITPTHLGESDKIECQRLNSMREGPGDSYFEPAECPDK